MKKLFKTPLLLAVLLITFLVVSAQLIFIYPVSASPDNTVDSDPTNHFTDLSVTNPTWAYDQETGKTRLYQNRTSYANFEFSAATGVMEVKEFWNTTSAKVVPPLPSILKVDFKMRYQAANNTAKTPNDQYRIVYYVDPSATATVLVPWTYGVANTTLATYSWLDQPEPNDGTWSWLDVSNIRFAVETFRSRGQDGGYEFRIYGAWVTLTYPDVDLVVRPQSLVDLGLTPEAGSPITIRPNAAGSWSMWTGDYGDWNETSHDGDGSYVYATSAPLRHSDNLEDVTSPPSWTIASVRVVVYARYSEAADDLLFLQLTSGGSTYYGRVGGNNYGGKVSLVLTTSYQKYSHDWAVNPATNSPWSWSDINSLEAGVENELVGSWSATLEMRVTQLYVEISGPRAQFDIRAENVVDLYAYSFMLSYDTAVLTAIGFAPQSPIQTSAPSEINDDITSVTNEAVGTGDGTTTIFYLDNIPVIDGSETIYLNTVSTTAYTINYTIGEITFNTAPGVAVAITADYQYSAYVAIAYTMVFGTQEGVSGNRSLAKIIFLVDGTGETDLDLHDIGMSQVVGSISHVIYDGYFKNAEAVPEFPLGLAIELALIVPIIYVWWKRKSKNRISKLTHSHGV